jgi:hypothetical protein
MGHVAVEFEDEFIPLFQRPFKSGKISPPEAVFLGAVQDMDDGMPDSQFLRQLAGAIWRIIVNYQDVYRDWKGQQLLHERYQILALVIGWHYDQGLVHC